MTMSRNSSTSNGEAPVFGIDLGTTNSCIARIGAAGAAEALVNQDQMLTTPSVVAFPSTDEVVVGVTAKRLAAVMPEAVCSHVKRKMGMAPGSPEARLELRGRSFSPEEISALILRKVVKDALITLGRQVSERVKAVITVPAYFGSIPKNATQNAAELAGIELLDLIHEPVAAAVSYGFGRANSPMNLLVYDLGGGTFDATVVRIEGQSIRTVATDGERLLGGLDWDERIVEWLHDQFEARFPAIEMNLGDPQLKARLFTLAEQAKIALSDVPTTTLTVHHGGQSLSLELTRKEFEERTADKLNTTIEKTRAVLAEARKEGVTRIDRVLLVGGSSKMPAIPKRLTGIPQLRDVAVNLYQPDLAVAKGAAVLADMITRGEQKADLTGSDATTGEGRLVTMVNAKGIGAVLQDRETKQLFVRYVIPRNTELPASVETTFYTTTEDQDGVDVTIVEERGEPSEKVEENTMLNDRTFDFPNPLPADSPLLARFTLDGAGILHVFLTEPKSGSTWEMTVDRYKKVSESDVLRLKPVIAQVS
jgi:molecular chaperone DnaK (HSP70)